MSDYTISAVIDQPYDEVVPRVREALAHQGFGVLTEIDVRATMRAKLGADVPDHVILGACRPDLAHRALGSAPSVAALLPCSVSVRRADDKTLVESINPEVISNLEDDAEIRAVAAEARARLQAALTALSTTTTREN